MSATMHRYSSSNSTSPRGPLMPNSRASDVARKVGCSAETQTQPPLPPAPEVTPIKLNLWQRWLDGTVDKNVENPKGTAAVAIKTSADQLIWAPVMTAVFFAFLKALEGTPELIIPTLQTKVIPTVAANYVIWPAAHVISFKYVPSHQRILYNNVIAIFWNCYLSIVAADSGMDGNQVADAAAAITGAGESLIGLGEVAERVQDTLPFGGFWLHDMLSMSTNSTFALAGSEGVSTSFMDTLIKMQTGILETVP